MDDFTDIFYINGMFLLFSEEHVMKLRRQRIVGQLIGCAPKNPHQILISGFPYHLSHYAVAVALKNKLARFKKLLPQCDSKCYGIEANFDEKVSQLREQAKKEYVDRRIDELKKRNIDVTDSRLGQFDEKKIKLTIQTLPDPNSSSCSLIEMTELEVMSSLKTDSDKMIVYQDLYDRGFYISSGMKFGSDFLGYSGDPIRYHARYAVKVVAGIDEHVDLNRVNFSEINALQRLNHTANKIPLFAVVCLSSRAVKYWTLRTREYLLPKSDASAFTEANPTSCPL